MPTPARTLLTAALLGAAVSVCSCSWVELKTGADSVDVATRQEIAGCQRIGRTTVSVADRVAAVQRSPSKVAEELTTLARNSAVDMKGDTIVPESRIQDGEQTFGVYRCVSR